MKVLANIPLVLWGAGALFPLAKHKRKIRKYREEGDFEKERAEILKAENEWGMSACQMIGLDLRVTGLENVPDGPVVFVANHQGYCDIVAFAAAMPDKPVGFIAKESLGKIPFYGRWILEVRSVYLPKDDPRGALRTIETGISYLKDGFSMVIFPEGRRSFGPEMGEFKRGSLRLATKPGVPAVSYTHLDVYKRQPKDWRWSPTICMISRKEGVHRGLSLN